MNPKETVLGYVRRVGGSVVFVAIPGDISLAPRTVNGHEYRIAQVGSFVRIPLKDLDLFGIISAAGTSETASGRNGEELESRWVEVHLVGESNRKGGFTRGVTLLPSLHDEVHFATLLDMAIIYGGSKRSDIHFGAHAMAENLAAHLDLDKLITRHGVVFGATGSGKSNAVALLLRQLTEGQFPHAQIVVLDPHGEYESALKDRARVFSIKDSENPFFIPYWALPYDELAWFLVDRNSAVETQQDKILREKIYEEKRRHCVDLKSGGLNENEVSADSPVPFDLNKVWFDLYYAEHATYWEKENYKKIAYKMSLAGTPLKGSPAMIIPPEFEPASSSGNAPYPSPRKAGMGVYLNKIQMRLRDHSFDFLLHPEDYDGNKKDLSDLLDSWLGHSKPITVFNLAGVPFEIMDLVAALVSKILFQAMFWGRDVAGFGRQRPLLMIYEEAHSYLSRAQDQPFVNGYSRQAVRRVFKEGRKYGIGALVISQRPSELEPTILSESGTFIALRLTNSQDQRLIHDTLPDGLHGLTNLLASLRTGEAIIAGESVQIPSRVQLPLVEPRPKSEDTQPAREWKQKEMQKPPFKQVVTAWRKQQMLPEPSEIDWESQSLCKDKSD